MCWRACSSICEGAEGGVTSGAVLTPPRSCHDHERRYLGSGRQLVAWWIVRNSSHSIAEPRRTCLSEARVLEQLAAGWEAMYCSVPYVRTQWEGSEGTRTWAEGVAGRGSCKKRPYPRALSHFLTPGAAIVLLGLETLPHTSSPVRCVSSRRKVAAARHGCLCLVDASNGIGSRRIRR